MKEYTYVHCRNFDKPSNRIKIFKKLVKVLHKFDYQGRELIIHESINKGSYCVTDRKTGLLVVGSIKNPTEQSALKALKPISRRFKYVCGQKLLIKSWEFRLSQALTKKEYRKLFPHKPQEKPIEKSFNKTLAYVNNDDIPF
jgi:hypothetical protein